MNSISEYSSLLEADNSEPQFIKVPFGFLSFSSSATAIFISLLMQQEKYNRNKKFTDEDGYFMFTREYVKNKVFLTYKMQQRITRELVEVGLIEYKKKGIPQKGWIRINHDLINSILDEYKKKQIPL